MSEREILFRGKRVDNGEWIEGGFVPSLDGKRFYIGNMFECVEIIPDTVGQYTGLKDKNGTRIFEGDILIYEYDEYYDPDEIIIVKWYAVGFALKFQYRNGKSYYDPEWASCVKYLEVIGNIYDNPELLKGE